MSVTPNDVRHVARLSRVGVEDARIPSLVAELNGILQHMDVLQQVSLAEGSADITLGAAPLRADDRPADPLMRRRDEFAPAERDGFFLVPRLATHGVVGTVVSEEQ